MHFLITNDDGINEPGILRLVEVAEQFGRVTVVAPDRGWSGCGHQTTTDRPLRIQNQREGWFACDGTPADCVRLGLRAICPEVDWVLSGINPGGNLGVDMVMSGTVAAAREAMYLGKPAAAFSQYRLRRGECDWSLSAKYAAQVLGQLLQREKPCGYWNANFPDGVTRVPQIIEARADPNPLLVAFAETPEGYLYQSNYHQRPRISKSDVDVCFGGDISLTFVDNV